MITCYTRAWAWLSTILQLFSSVLLDLSSSCPAFTGKPKGSCWRERQQEAWERRAMSSVHWISENEVSSIPAQGILRISQKNPAYSHLLHCNNVIIHSRWYQEYLVNSLGFVGPAGLLAVHTGSSFLCLFTAPGRVSCSLYFIFGKRLPDLIQNIRSLYPKANLCLSVGSSNNFASAWCCNFKQPFSLKSLLWS